MSGFGDALARAAAWLVDPEAEELASARAELRLLPAPVEACPLIAVVGLAPGCGTTTVARALAATLARRNHSGAAIVAGPGQPLGSRLATRPASRLTTRLASIGRAARPAGRLCLTQLDAPIPRIGPVVLDLPSGDAAAATVAAARPVLLVAPGDAEPALADLAAQSLGARTVVVGPDDLSRWAGRALVTVPRSRVGARVAAAGWEPRGAFGRAIAQMADACEERAA